VQIALICAKGGCVEVEKLVRFGVAVPESLLEEFDKWIQRSGIPNRSNALRQLIRQSISRNRWEEGEGKVSGTLTILYDHHSYDTSAELTQLQHDFGDIIVCSTHVHLDHSHCLEAIVLRGPAKKIRSFVTAISSIKGINSADAAITTTV
jgi:CopG family nickel-responsive transcriptional regulator